MIGFGNRVYLIWEAPSYVVGMDRVTIALASTNPLAIIDWARTRPPANSTGTTRTMLSTPKLYYIDLLSIYFLVVRVGGRTDYLRANYGRNHRYPQPPPTYMPFRFR